MFLELIRGLLIFSLLALGLAWPLAARLPLAPVEKIVASTVLSLIAVWLFGWTLYICALPWPVLWLLPVLAAAGLFFWRRALVETLRDVAARECLGAQFLVSAWGVGWLCLVQSYSGGGWTSDWYEHWERARFFLNHESLDRQFLGIYAVTARPPMANLLTGVWLSLTRVDFAHYQLFSTLFGSLAFLPAALLTLRWGGGRSGLAVLAVLFMVNPLFVQNAVFPWTKLPAALFIIAALGFFLRCKDGAAPRTFGGLFSLSIAAGLIIHYSAAPYALVLALAWCLTGAHTWGDRGFLRVTVLAAAAGFALLATWFGWAIMHYGVHGTVSSNTSVTMVDQHAGDQLVRALLNLRDTIVPHFLRSPDPALIAQSSAWGWWRDWFFQSYQLNLFFIFGSVGWLVVLREALRLWPATASGPRWFWTGFVAGVVVLGVGVHGPRDIWGLAHICLQALVLIGLAFLAARWRMLGRGWRIILVAGAACDLVLGIGLHFAVQSHALDRWFGTSRSTAELLHRYNEPAFMNLAGKIQNQLEFFSDVFAPPHALVLALLTAILMLALRRIQSAAKS